MTQMHGDWELASQVLLPVAGGHTISIHLFNEL